MNETNGTGSGSRDGNTPEALEPADAEKADPYSGLLQSFLQEVLNTIERLQQGVRGLTVSTKKRPEEILSMLPQILQFEQMSLLEVQYSLSGSARRPGIRFWLEGPRRDKRLRAVLFEDTRIWDVSYSLQKLYTELGVFRLQEGEIIPQPAPALFGRPALGLDWKACLRAVLRFPVPGISEDNTSMEGDG
jgi:hypothetical protein